MNCLKSRTEPERQRQSPSIQPLTLIFSDMFGYSNLNAVLGPSGSGAVSKTVIKTGSNPVHRTIYYQSFWPEEAQRPQNMQSFCASLVAKFFG